VTLLPEKQETGGQNRPPVFFVRIGKSLHVPRCALARPDQLGVWHARASAVIS
jgi:hypothetical protein